MPTCNNCGFSQNVGEFTNNLCENCQPNRSLISQLTEKETEIIELKETLDKYAEQIKVLQEKHTNYLNSRKTQLTQEITLIKEVLND